MNWLQDLLTNPNSIAHIVALYAFVIAAGVLLGKIKFFGISLGVTFVLFVGILAGHFGFTGNPAILSFVQDFGLILFVFCIGLQVGPSFFSSFKRGGITLNLLAVGIVFLNIAVALILYFALQGRVDIPMMVGILCGAVTNTPGLGAANEALQQLHYQGPEIAMGYACAYPLGVMGIILSMIIIRYICRVDVQRDSDEIQKEEEANPHMKPYTISLKVQNEALSGKTLSQVQNFLARDFVCTRIIQDGHMITPNANTVLRLGDRMFLVCAEDDSEAIMAFIGPKIEQDWDATNQQDKPMVSRRILVTQPNINGKTLGELHFSSMYGVNVTRVNRSGMDLFAARQLRLQVGDRVMVVGPQDAIERVANLLGNQLRRLDHPNIVTIFVGILCGILFGSLPIAIPGMPTPVKLGLAGGPLIISILIGRFGHKVKLVTYTTMSANLMLREVGLVLFLASVGIKARLVHPQSHSIFLRLQRRAPHSHIGASHAQFVVALQAVEDDERCLQAVAVIEGVDIGVGVGLGVDSASEVHLCAHRAVHFGQESTDGTCAFGATYVEVVLLQAHRVTVLGGVLHATLHAPRFGCLSRQGGKQGE